MAKDSDRTLIASNKKARYEYLIEDVVEAEPADPETYYGQPVAGGAGVTHIEILADTSSPNVFKTIAQVSTCPKRIEHHEPR